MKELEIQKRTADDVDKYANSVYGIEKKALPFLLCATNLLLHDIDNPNIIHGNSLEKNVKDYSEKDKFNIIIMNPPYGSVIWSMAERDVLAAERTFRAFYG